MAKKRKKAVEPIAIVLAERVSATLALSADVPVRTLYLWGAIDEASALKFIVALKTVDSVPGLIHVLLCSGGGEEHAGYAIYDALCQTHNHVTIIATGCCASISALILQGADTRLMTPECRFMVHNGSVGLPEHTIDSNIVVAMGKEQDRSAKNYQRVLAERSGWPAETLRVWCDAETHWSADEAVANGFADGIYTGDTK